MRLKVLAVTVLGMAAVIFAPVTAAAVGMFAWAWLRGWSPTRARYVVASAWLLPLLAWAAGWTPPAMWDLALERVHVRAWASAWVPLLPVLVPAGVTVGAALWAAKWNAARNGVFRSPRQAGIWMHRQFSHAMRRAVRESRRAGLVPMTDRRGDLVLGRAAMETQSGAGSLLPADPRLLRIPLGAIDRHLVVVGESGAGKTVLLLRLMRAWMEATWLRHVQGAGDRPLLVFLDCKGGSDGARTAREFAGMAMGLGLAPGRIGLWPSQQRLDLWPLPPARLVETLTELYRVDHPHYEAIRNVVVDLAVNAPGAGPPSSSADFVSRLNAQWLLDRYTAAYPGEREIITQNRQEFSTVALRFRDTFRKLGQTFDSGRHLDDFDALCLTLEGTQNAATAAAQAQAIEELVKDLATRGGPSGLRRKVLLVVDEFSAISERVDVSLLMERGRSLGIGVIPAGQSWVSLGTDVDQRDRLISAAAGGMLLMATPSPERLVAYGGSLVAVDVGVKRGEEGWDDGGMGRARPTFLADPDWVRQLGRGQAVYIGHGRALWGAVTPTERTDGAPPLLPERSLRKEVVARRLTVVTEGDRIPLRELEAGLAGLDDVSLKEGVQTWST